MLSKNIFRARRAYATLDNYPDGSSCSPAVVDLYAPEDVKHDPDPDAETNAQDMLTDIMHLCELCGFDFESMLRMARNNYEAERDGREE